MAFFKNIRFPAAVENFRIQRFPKYAESTKAKYEQLWKGFTEERVRWVTDIDAETIGKVLSKVSSPATRYVLNEQTRTFQKWVEKTYDVPAYMPPRTARGVVRRVAYGSLPEMRRRVERCVGGMRMPHEKLLFLCGYLYGMTPRQVMIAEVKDLAALPMRNDFYRYLTDAKLAPSGPAFAPWKRGYGFAEWWRRTCGLGHDVPWGDIVKAGQMERMMLGIKPTVAPVQARHLLALMPELDRKNIEKLPKPWGDVIDFKVA